MNLYKGKSQNAHRQHTDLSEVSGVRDDSPVFRVGSDRHGPVSLPALPHRHLDLSESPVVELRRLLQRIERIPVAEGREVTAANKRSENRGQRSEVSGQTVSI